MSASSTSVPLVRSRKACSTHVEGPPFLKRLPLADEITSGLTLFGVITVGAWPNSAAGCIAPSPATALRCRNCGATYPLIAVHACAECFGPLEVAYDEKLLAAVTREQIESGPHNIWLKLATDEGIGAAILFTLMLGAACWQAVKTRSPVLLCASAIALTAALFSQTAIVNPLIPALLAIGMGMAQPQRRVAP